MFYSDCLIRYKNRQGPTIIIPDARLKVKIRNPRYNIQDARCKTIAGRRYAPDTIDLVRVICTRYNIPGTWYVYKVLYLVLVLVQAAFERTEGNTEGNISSFFSSIICLLLLVAKSNRFGLFEEEGKMRPVFEIEIDILSTENGYLGGVFYNSSRLSDILPDSRSLFEIED